MPNVSILPRSKLVLMPPGTQSPTKTRVRLCTQGTTSVLAESFPAFGVKQNYPNMSDGTFTVRTLNMLEDGAAVGDEVAQDVTIVDGVMVPVADGVDVIYEPA